MCKELKVNMTITDLVQLADVENVQDVLKFLNVRHGIKLKHLAKVIGITDVALRQSYVRGYFYKDFIKDEEFKRKVVLALRKEYLGR